MESQWKNGEFIPTYGAAIGTTEQPKPWPTPEEQAQNIAWTVRTPRPKSGDCEDYLLAGRQEEWDKGEAQRQTHEAAVAELRTERASAKEKAEAERAAVFAAEVAAKAQQREEQARIRYLAAGGSATGWEQDREAVLRSEVLKRMDGVRGGALISPREMVLG